MKTDSTHRHIEVFNIGVGTTHTVGHESSVPQGYAACYTILCFQTPFIGLTANGKETGTPGDCQILQPGFPQWHTNLPGAERGFRNGWCHVAVPDHIR
ncbi:MAG: hypothetical protein HN341_10940 [Verrucomicrobia bacterium]|jgi:hypothetical protein|nr:hypothetical protein [Verrucomicrobiota bacterium]